MIEVIFLIVLALIWTIFATIVDCKHRIVPNWLNFSLIIFALGLRFFYSLFQGDFDFFVQGLLGLGIFFVFGNALYYGRMFAGGDAKFMIALGAVLSFSENLIVNANIFVLFFIPFLFSGAFYGLVWSAVLTARNYHQFKKEFFKQFNKNKKSVYFALFFGTLILFFGFFETSFFYLSILIFAMPYFYIYAKAVDESCLIKNVKTKDLTEGDWLYKDLKIGKKIIKASWGGLTKEEIKFIRKKFKEVKIRHGIPFTPVFLISFLALISFYFKGINLASLI